jgi:exopolysaccharide biosynthesis polyprenyl glycosylphosphotransferase
MMSANTEYISGLISVIVPNYNREEYLKTTIQSVMRQTYPHWELLFIDDCSTDNSVAIVEELQQSDNRIKVLKTPHNFGGPAGPRNIGLDNAKGEYVAFLDSDDVWHPHKLSLQIELMQKHNINFCFSDIINFLWDPMLDWVMPTKIDVESIQVSHINHSKLLKKNVIPNSSVIVKRSFFKAFRFNEDQRYHAIEDYHAWLILHQHSIKVSLKIHIPLTFYRIHRNAISSQKINMLRKNYHLLSEYEINGKKLGKKKFFYLSTYIIQSAYKVVKSYLYFKKNKEPFLAMLQEHAPKAQTAAHVEQATKMPETDNKTWIFTIFSKRNTPVLFQLTGDIIAVFLASCLFMMIGMITGIHAFPRDVNTSDILSLAAINIVAWVTVFWFSGLYANWYIRSPFDELFRSIRTTFIGCLVLYSIIVFDSEIERIRLKFFIFWLILVFFIGSARLCVRLIQRILRKNRTISIPTILLGDSESLSELLTSIRENPAWGYEVQGVILTDEKDSSQWLSKSTLPIIGYISDFSTVITQVSTESLLISWENPPHPQLLEISALCGSRGINVKIKPDLYDIFTGRVKTLPIFSSQLIEIQAQILTPWQSFLKRTLDLIFASLFILLGLPLWICLAIGVKLDSPGPVFYTQNRVGKNGKIFRIYKFRSMAHGASQQQFGIWTSKNDPRVTKFGKFIRKTHLDEVPQMWNVIIGDMSVVGPRPEQPSIVEKYISLLPIYARRHMVRPGITGWWQIKSRAYEESLAEMQRRLRYDFYYIENLSVKLDIEIIFRTVYTVISGHGQA